MGYIKWIGAVLGSILGHGVFGGIAGYALGSLIESQMSGENGDNSGSNTDSSRRSEPTSEEQRNSFLFSLMLLSAHIIQADGKIMHSEMNCVREMLRNTYGEHAVTQGEEILRRLFDLRKSKGESQWNADIRKCCQQLAFAFTEEQRLQIVAFLCEIARSDKHLDEVEVKELHMIAVNMRLSASAVDQLLSLGGNTIEDDYKLLGVAPDASDDEVKRAYRKMALQYHPDRVATLGDDVKMAAEKKFKEITAAKDRIFEARGIH